MFFPNQSDPSRFILSNDNKEKEELKQLKEFEEIEKLSKQKGLKQPYGYQSLVDKNVVKIKDSKIGIKQYNWFVAFFVWAFSWLVGSGITTIKDGDKKIYFNTNSVINWIKRHEENSKEGGLTAEEQKKFSNEIATRKINAIFEALEPAPSSSETERKSAKDEITSQVESKDKFSNNNSSNLSILTQLIKNYGKDRNKDAEINLLLQKLEKKEYEDFVKGLTPDEVHNLFVSKGFLTLHSILPTLAGLFLQALEEHNIELIAAYIPIISELNLDWNARIFQLQGQDFQQLCTSLTNQLGEKSANDLIKDVFIAACRQKTPNLKIAIYDEVQLNELIKRIGKNEMQEIIKNLMTNYDNIGKSPHLLVEGLLKNCFSGNSLEELSKLGLKLYDENTDLCELITLCLRWNNLSAFKITLKQLDDKTISNANTADLLVGHVMNFQDPEMGKLILEREPKILSYCSLDMLEKGIEGGSGWFVSWALNNGMAIGSKERWEKIIHDARATYNLPLIKSLCSKAIKEGLTKETYPGILGLEKINDPKEQELTLKKYAMCSPLSDIYELVKDYPLYAAYLPIALETIRLLVRFPDALARASIEEKLESYLAGSIEYSKGNSEDLGSLVSSLKQLTHDRLLDATVEKRKERNPKLKQGYKVKQINEAEEVITFITLIEGDEAANKYSWCLRHLNKSNKSSPSFSVNNGTATYSYSYPNQKGQIQKVTVTKISEKFMGNPLFAWFHNSVPILKDMQPHLEQLYQDLINYKLDFSNPQNIKTFYTNLGTYYWLMSTLCEMHRGTPHNAMMRLNAITDFHKLPPLIPTIDHFFLDNTALVLSVEEFTEKFASMEFFEPLFDQALRGSAQEKRTFLEKCLAQNGLLLRFCSEQVRGDPELVAIATKQNKEASQYAIASISQRERKDEKSKK